jgi:hypothetical protein
MSHELRGNSQRQQSSSLWPSVPLHSSGFPGPVVGFDRSDRTATRYRLEKGEPQLSLDDLRMRGAVPAVATRSASLFSKLVSSDKQTQAPRPAWSSESNVQAVLFYLVEKTRYKSMQFGMALTS